MAVDSDSLPVSRLRFTNSEMKTWQRCRRKWYLGQYLRRGKRTPEFGRPTSLGTIVHSALQDIYDPAKRAVDVLAEMDKRREADLAEYPRYTEDILKDHAFARIMVEGYLEWLAEEGHDQDLELVETERGLEVGMPGYEPENVTLLSKLDARVVDRQSGARWALEHKTAPSVKMQLPLLQIDFQLLTEHLVEYLNLLEEGHTQEEADALRVDGVKYNMLRKVKRTAASKPPFYAREEVRHNIHELRNHWAHVKTLIDEIVAARAKLDAGADHHSVVPPNPTRDCSWDCPFLQICGMMDDGSDWWGAVNDIYEEVDPLERYARELNDVESE